MASTTLYAIVEKSLPQISLTLSNADGHDLRSVAPFQELSVPYDIKENDRVIVVCKKDYSCVCSVIPYSTENDDACVVNDDETSYTMNVPLNSWYGVR
jgi:phosphatidylserine decarboxylase